MSLADELRLFAIKIINKISMHKGGFANPANELVMRYICMNYRAEAMETRVI